MLIDFLINLNLCILNGRNYVNNDYTSVSVKGKAAVDYCIVPYDCLDCLDIFQGFLSYVLLI